MKYVGARYMPKFVGAYDNTTAYEALSVVDNGMGTSYVANKPVPAGTPLTDTNYWAVYGMSSGAILNLQQQIDDMNDPNVSGSLQDQINDNSLAITDLSNNEDLHGNKRNIICIGDSYAQWVEGSSVSWVSRLRDVLQNLGDFYHAERGGACFLGEYDSDPDTKSFKELLQSLEGTVTEPNRITDVIVCGGYNDLSVGHPYISNFQTALAAFKTYAKATYPKAKIWVGFIARSTTLSTISSLIHETFLNYYVGCNNVGVNYLSGVEMILHSDSQMRLDETPPLHPNSTGSIDLGNAINQCLSGQYPTIYVKSTANLVNSALAAAPTFTVYNINEFIEFVLNNATLTYTTATAWNLDQTGTITLGDINYGAIHVFDSPRFPCSMLLVLDNNSFMEVDGYLFIDDKTLKFSCSHITSGSWTNINVKSAIIRGANLRLDKHQC